MIGPSGNFRVYLACGVTDMRRGIDGLSAFHIFLAIVRRDEVDDVFKTFDLAAVGEFRGN